MQSTKIAGNTFATSKLILCPYTYCKSRLSTVGTIWYVYYRFLTKRSRKIIITKETYCLKSSCRISIQLIDLSSTRTKYLNNIIILNKLAIK